MDKFGIFNLLNSFFNFYQNKTGEATNDSAFNPEQLFAPKPTADKPLPSADKPLQAKERPAPLQAQMLDVIASHDAIVKRVKASQKKD